MVCLEAVVWVCAFRQHVRIVVFTINCAAGGAEALEQGQRHEQEQQREQAQALELYQEQGQEQRQ